MLKEVVGACREIVQLFRFRDGFDPYGFYVWHSLARIKEIRDAPDIELVFATPLTRRHGQELQERSKKDKQDQYDADVSLLRHLVLRWYMQALKRAVCYSVAGALLLIVLLHAHQ